WSGEKPPWQDEGLLRMEATEDIRHLTETTVFTLSCTGPTGSASESVTVLVDGFCHPPSFGFSASKARLELNEPAKLEWFASGVSSCTAVGGWADSVPLRTRAFEMFPNSSSQTYGLRCVSPTRQFAKTVGIGVGKDAPPTIFL